MAVAARVMTHDAPPAFLLEQAHALDRRLRLSAPPRRWRVAAMGAYHMGWTEPDGRPADGSPGKLLRAGLAVWACAAYGGDARSALPAALGVEWIHNFTLIHDDIQDGDRQRRHRPAVWTVWGPAQAINAGDGLHAVAHWVMTRPGPHPERRLAAAHALSRAILEVIEGQCLDLELEGGPPAPVATQLRVARAKTGALFGGALEAGALLAGAPRADALRLRRAGRELGAAFQVRDDWLGTWGDPAATGKPRGADLVRRKQTHALAVAAAQSPPALRRRLEELTASPGEEGAAELRSILDAVDAGPRTADAARRLGRRALAELEPLPLDGRRRTEIAELVAFATERTR